MDIQWDLHRQVVLPSHVQWLNLRAPLALDLADLGAPTDRDLHMAGGARPVLDSRKAVAAWPATQRRVCSLRSRG